MTNYFRIAKFELISQHMPAEEMIEVDSMTEEEVVDIIIETMTMMIERQEIGDRVHHHHLGIMIETEDTIEVVIEEAVIETVVEDLTAMNHQENEGVMIETTVETIEEEVVTIDTIGAMIEEGLLNLQKK